MKLLKRNLNHGQEVKVNASDAFDEICTNNFGSLEDWDIKCFEEFENAFKKDKEMEIICGQWAFSNIPKGKKTHEDFILELRDRELTEYMDNLVSVAENILQELKGYRKKLDDKDYIKSSGKEKIVQWAMNQAQQVNWHFDDGADVIARYVEAKVRKELAEKQG